MSPDLGARLGDVLGQDRLLLLGDPTPGGDQIRTVAHRPPQGPGPPPPLDPPVVAVAEDLRSLQPRKTAGRV